MVSLLANWWIQFLAGIFVPLGAVCVLPLYPGFLAYLSNQVSGKESKRTIFFLGLVVVLGVMLSMGIVGLIFTKILQASLTNAIQVISPIAFGLLGIVSIFMIFNFDFTRFLPQVHLPIKKNPYVSALLFGAFFGLIVLPCNPAALVVLFAISTSTTDFITNFIGFLIFGLGMGLPLLILSILSAQYSKSVIGFLTKHKRSINLVAGIIMLAISLYYLLFVFKILS